MSSFAVKKNLSRGYSVDDEPNYDHLEAFESNISDPNSMNSKDFAPSISRDFSVLPVSQYILGTVMVRIVAARNLKPMLKGGLGQFLLGSSGYNNSKRSRASRIMDRGSANPYATITFGGQSQRTSQMHDTLDPVFPRNDESYFDVTLPIDNIAFEENGHGELKCKKKGFVRHHSNTSGSPEHGKFSSSASGAPHNPTIYLPPPLPQLTIHMFHKNDMRSSFKNSKKKRDEKSPESEDFHMGVGTINLISIITGKTSCIDAWVPLFLYNENDHYNSHNCVPSGEIRVICEYEPADPPPRPGDTCRLTTYCNPHDLFPLITPYEIFQVDDVVEDDVILSYRTTPEGWLFQFRVHRNMVVCAVRHQAAIERYRDHIQEMADKLAHSPMFDTVTDVLTKRLPEDGLLNIGKEGVVEGLALLGRWFEGGVGTVIDDVLYASNWNGQHSNGGRTESDDDWRCSDDEEKSFLEGHLGTKEDLEGPEDLWEQESLPGMPCCPITGQSMRDPVVAADGHTYEKMAILRWLETSDKSPLTGEVMPHKEVVTNYLLLSSLNSNIDINVEEEHKE